MKQKLAAPMVMRGFSSYTSPINEELVQSRKEHERHMTTHDVMPAQEVKPRQERKKDGRE
jgi:hypothetical protein